MTYMNKVDLVKADKTRVALVSILFISRGAAFIINLLTMYNSTNIEIR